MMATSSAPTQTPYGRENSGFQSQLIRIVSIPVVFILVLLVFFHFQSAYVESLNAETGRLDKVRMGLLQFEKTVASIENSLRGFVISGESQFQEETLEGTLEVQPLAEAIFKEIGDDYKLNKEFRGLMSTYQKFETNVRETMKMRKSEASDIEEEVEEQLLADVNHFGALKEKIVDLDGDITQLRDELNASLRHIVKWTGLVEVVFTLCLAFFVAFIMIKQLKKLTFEYRRLLDENTHAMHKLEESSKTKDLFLANMSHEIRTPLGAILGFAELLQKDDKLNSESQSHVAFIRRNSEHLLSMVDDLFDLSRLEADKLDLSYGEFHLGQFINDLQNYFSSRLHDKRMELDIRLDTRVPEKIKTDVVRLKQVMSNLLGNAIKFSPEKSKVRLVVSFASGRLQFDVIDQGIGINPEAQHVIFDAFTQADEQHTRNFGGAGLGLSISKKLVELLGGDLTLVSSQVNVGSHFRLTIPCQSADRVYVSADELMSFGQSESVNEAQALAESETFDFTGKRILLAEDSKENQILFKIFIETSHAELSIVDNGSEAVRKALSEDFDLILMDIQMPGLDGYEAVKILRGSQYDKKVLALTAHTMKGEKEKCFAAGFDDYLSKPIGQKTLLKKISENFA